MKPQNFNILDYNIIVILFFEFLLLLTPIPTTIIIVLNGYLFKEIGFFISFFLIIICSIIIFKLAKKIRNYFNINLNFIFYKKKIPLEKFSNNNLSVFFLRLSIPYFFHNLYYGLSGLKFKNFLLVILLSEIPILYALNKIGSSLTAFNFYEIHSLNFLKDWVKITSLFQLSIKRFFENIFFVISC